MLLMTDNNLLWIVSKETYDSVQRYLRQCQKRPTTVSKELLMTDNNLLWIVSKETYDSVNRTVSKETYYSGKRPTTVSKETYDSVKRDLLQCQKSS